MSTARRVARRDARLRLESTCVAPFWEAHSRLPRAGFARSRLAWIAIPAPIARKHTRFIGEFLVSLAPWARSRTVAFMTIDEISDNFFLLDDWEDRYRYIIEFGRTLAPLPAEAHIDANKVQGCASQVWLTTVVQPNESRCSRRAIAPVETAPSMPSRTIPANKSALRNERDASSTLLPSPGVEDSISATTDRISANPMPTRAPERMSGTAFGSQTDAMPLCGRASDNTIWNVGSHTGFQSEAAMLGL